MNPYYLDVAAAMSAMPPAEPLQSVAPIGPPAPPPPAPWVPPDPLASVQPANANRPGANAMTGYDPLKDSEAVIAPALDDAIAQANAPPPQAQAAAPRAEGTAPISLARAGGVIPAHEQSRLGPTQWAALEAGNMAQEQAIGDIAVRGGEQAVRDEAVYMQHAIDARAREEAAAKVAMARNEELQARASDFDRQARVLSQEKLDPGRLWATKSTPQKVATFISIALGGFLSGARGGENLAWQRVNEEIERDIDAQKLAIGLKRDRLEASHTAYGMALQRYQSEDAARAFARVAAMDAVAAEIARQQAQNKGTDVANRAQAALAELAQNRAAQIQQGIAFIPSRVVEPRYHVANRLGTYTAREIDEKQIAPEEERGFKLQMEDRKIEGEIRKEGAKQGAEDAKYIANALQQAGIPQAMEAAEMARKAILANPKSYTERVVEKLPGSGETTRKYTSGGDAVKREQAWNNYKNAAMKALFGNVTTGEEARAKAALEGAGDDESRLAAIEMSMKIAQAQKENILKGASDRGDRDYANRERDPGGPKALSRVAPSFKPAGR